MISYELAKELKEAGFPQTCKVSYAFVLTRDGGRKPVPVKSAGPRVNEMVCAPTLEELIEACGEDFSELYRYENGFAAKAHAKQMGATGLTPAEAVARLWLALNPKK